MSEVFAERDYHPHDMTPIGDAARRVASYTEGKERLNVYKAARDELAALEARATAAEAREAKLREALEPFAKAGAIRLVGGEDYWTDDRRIQGTDIAFHITFGDLRQARAALETDNG